MKFDVVVDWIAYTPADIERSLELFQGKVKQFIFISSASAYQKPPSHPIITESTPLYNPYWEYSRNKIACEERLLAAYRQDGFPVTIVRPSLTYDSNFPIAIGGWGCYTLADRLLKGQPIIVHGDGASLWVVTHSEDFARGFLGLVGNWQTLGHAFHITTDEVLTWNQIYETIADALGVEANIVHIASDFIAKCRAEFGRWFDRRQSLERDFRQQQNQNLRAGFSGGHPLPRGHPPDAGMVRCRRKAALGQSRCE